MDITDIRGFKIINATNLSDAQMNEVTSLHLESGYYKHISLNNKLNLAPLPFQKIQTIQPFIRYTYVLINMDNEVIGFFIAATKCQIEDIEKNIPNWYSDNCMTIDFFERVSLLYMHNTADTDLILYSAAIKSSWRGKGLFKMLYNQLLDLAKKELCHRIVFLVWVSKPALAIYMHLGAKVLGEMDFTGTLVNDKLIKCCFEL
ncbi:MAG: hypothetical protein K0R14_1330 [Burkholderiales bacterium]|jgi:GNAT superfamily N-acetyltransferase|nr:hypothetical protein [Burkholderiales bacterium]